MSCAPACAYRETLTLQTFKNGFFFLVSFAFCCEFCLCVAGMPLAQAISILQKHCRIIKNVQVLYSEQVRWFVFWMCMLNSFSLLPFSAEVFVWPHYFPLHYKPSHSLLAYYMYAGIVVYNKPVAVC